MRSSVRQALQPAGAQSASQPAHWARAGTVLAAGLLAVFYFLTSLEIAVHRVFWFDELFTLHIARLPHWTAIWSALGNGVDALPPTYYMLVRGFDARFGPAEIAARLPSALGMVIGLLLIFDCARRLSDGLHGLIALSVATCSFLPYYGYEARSYALYFMFSALAFWAWTYNGSRQNWATFLFGAAFFAGVCCHYYFVMCLVPYVLWELFRWKPGNRPSSDLLAGVAGAILPLVLLSPLILSFSRKFGGGYWNRPSFDELRAIYSQLFPDGLFLVALILLWIVLAGWGAERETKPMQAAEAVGWLFLSIPLAAFVVAEWKTNAFYSRYFIGVLPGVAVAFALLLWRHYRKATQVSFGVFVLLATWGIGQQLTVMRHPEEVEATGIRSFLQIESALQLEGKRYFVFSGPLLFLEAQQYSNYPGQCVLLLPSDFDQQAKSGPDPYLHQRLEMNLSAYYPLQFWTIDDLARHRSQSALIAPDDQAVKDLRAAGIRTGTRFSQPVQVDYLH
ncbi:MAG TPA: glycosyltransferase family 39 protein [Terriglobales bacterium]|nr:glycosyltransferase family 39 protein [Terriglobales bacterium]